MGFMDELASMADSLGRMLRSTLGVTDTALIANGVPGTAVITSLAPSATTVTIMNGLTERICTVGLTVTLPGQDPYEVTVTQGIPEIWIPHLTTTPYVAVKVDPADRNRVAIEISAAPTAQLTETVLPSKPSDDPDSAAWILANGSDVTITVSGVRQLPGVRNTEGEDVYILSLTVDAGDGSAPYPVDVGNAVPAAALPLLTTGAVLRAKRGEDPGDIVVNWAANGQGPATIL